jgi:hypothetical protein
VLSLTMAGACSNEVQKEQGGSVGESSTGTRSTGLTSSILPTEGLHEESAGPTEVELAWKETLGGTVKKASDSLTVELANTTKVTKEGRLLMVAIGLDGRKAERPLGTFSLAAGARATIAVPVSALPIQSEVATSFARVQVEIERAQGVVRLSTDFLYYIFSGGYEQAELYSAEEVKEQPNGGVRTTDLTDVRGRVLDANGAIQEVDINASANVGEGRQGLTVAMPVGSDLEPKDFLTNFPLAAPGSPTSPLGNITLRVCFAWNVWYADSGYGEDYLATVPPGDEQSVAAAFAWVGIWAPGVEVPWQGWLDQYGCSQWFTAPASIWLNSTIWTHSLDLAGTQAISYSWSWVSEPTRTSVITSFFTPSYSWATVYLEPGWNDANTQTQAIAGWVLKKNHERMQNLGERLLPAGTYRIGNGYVNSACGIEDPNVADGWLYTGAIPSDVGWDKGSFWKFVVAHELGHCAQFFGAGEIISPNGNLYDDHDSHPMCRCDHVAQGYGNAHCLQSREYFGAAEIEGFGHFFASRVFNNDQTWGAATFVYYKPFLPYEGAPEEEYLWPPDGFTAYRPQEWLLHQCDSPTPAGVGVEWDWLTFYYKLTARNQPNRLAPWQLDMIYRYACTGDIYAKCYWEDPPWDTLANSASYLRSASILTQGQYQTFLDLADQHGVNF